MCFVNILFIFAVYFLVDPMSKLNQTSKARLGLLFVFVHPHYMEIPPKYPLINLHVRGYRINKYISIVYVSQSIAY